MCVEFRVEVLAMKVVSLADMVPGRALANQMAVWGAGVKQTHELEE